MILCWGIRWRQEATMINDCAVNHTHRAERVSYWWSEVTNCHSLAPVTDFLSQAPLPKGSTTSPQIVSHDVHSGKAKRSGSSDRFLVLFHLGR